MYTLVEGKKFRKSVQRLDKVDKKKAAQKIEILKDNPKHPSLKTHWNKKRKAWQSSISNRIRIWWDYGPGEKEITLFVVGDHQIVE